jgi:hypothetical protein
MDAFQIEVLEKLKKIILNQKTDITWIQNIVSTLLGVILGTIITTISQRSGKLMCYIISYTNEYCSSDCFGIPNEIDTSKVPEYTSHSLIIDFHNSTQANVGIRNIHLEVHTENKKVTICKLKDFDTRRNSGSGIYMDTLEVINIEQKMIIRKKLETNVFTHEIGFFSNVQKVYFCYTTSKNRNRKLKIL